MKRQATQEEQDQAPDKKLLHWLEQQSEGEVADAALVAIGELPVREQEVVELRWIRGIDQARVGDVLNLTVRQVQTLEKRARARIIEKLCAGGVL